MHDYRNISSAFGFTPMTLLFGRHLVMFPDTGKSKESVAATINLGGAALTVQVVPLVDLLL